MVKASPCSVQSICPLPSLQTSMVTMRVQSLESLRSGTPSPPLQKLLGMEGGRLSTFTLVWVGRKRWSPPNNFCKRLVLDRSKIVQDRKSTRLNSSHSQI